MKKRLFLIIFVLSAVISSAQTTPLRHEPATPNPQKRTLPTFHQEFFSKSVPLATIDFGTANVGYTTGVITEGAESHTQTGIYSTWLRWPNTDSTTLASVATTYPTLYRNIFGGYLSQIEHILDTSTSSAENGFMMMSLYDQQTPHTGNFNAYIRFDNIDATSAEIIEVQFYQYYRKYYDRCYIDYSTDGSHWNEVEINVSGIDIHYEPTWGICTYRLPTAAAGNANLSIRLRYKSLDSDRNAYGYFWIIDDVNVIAGNPDRMTQYNQEYVEGNYGLIPTGLTINPAWYTHVQNSGIHTQTNVIATLYHLDANQSNRTTIANYNNGTIDTAAHADIICDKAGWLIPDSLELRGWYGHTSHTSNGAGTPLPTSTTGDNYLFANIHNDNIDLHYDTLLYQVTSADSNGNFRWGHDNGILTYSPYNYWLYGYELNGGNWYVAEDPEAVQFYRPGYTITSRYTTGEVIPEGWVIHGVELVASPVEGYHNTGTKISAVLTADRYNDTGLYLENIYTGANVKEIQASDINDTNVIGRNSNGYLTLGNYNTIFIKFLEQPTLEANTSYRIGYRMEEEGYFALADEAQGSYRMASPTRPDIYDTIIYFRNNETTVKYAHTFTPNPYQGYIYDPSYSGEGHSDMFTYYKTSNPMIRMIVGPGSPIVRHNIQIDCHTNNHGEVYYQDRPACDTTISPAEGSTCTIVGKAYNGGAAHVYVDGIERDPYDEDTETGDVNLIRQVSDSPTYHYTYSYTFPNIQEDHQIKFEFLESDGIDSIDADIHISLQPNPATTQVSLNINGITGIVNCTLIDISGRTVYNQHIPAGHTQVIDLSHLAKGAYFVRLTNDTFSKVEKLIIR